MPTALRPIGHEDRLSLVDHLSELRKRIVISIVTLAAAFVVCFWQSDAILDFITEPVRATQNLDNPSKQSADPLEQAALSQKAQERFLRELAPALALNGTTLRSLSRADNLTAAQRAQLARASNAQAAASREAARAAAALPKNTERNLVTLGVTEPFTATITVALYSALLLSLPLILFQMYAFVLPAFSPRERKTALPLMLMVPVLFIAGVAFGYFVVLDRAVDFLQNFNDDSFDILLRANDYFKFAVLFLAGIGLLFQIPVGVLAVTRLGILTPKQLAANRGYVILGIAVLAAIATPTPDPITMSFAMVPLIVLFELSILVARWIDRIKPPPDVDDEADVEHEAGVDDDEVDDEADEDDEADVEHEAGVDDDEVDDEADDEADVDDDEADVDNKADEADDEERDAAPPEPLDSDEDVKD